MKIIKFYGDSMADVFNNHMIVRDMLWEVAEGLERIHAERRIHGILHGGNLLIEVDYMWYSIALITQWSYIAHEYEVP